MQAVAIIKRRLKEGKTYEDFRTAWYHSVGFGTRTKMYSMINVFDPREIIVIGFVEFNPDKDLMSILRIDVEERLENPLDDVIEPDIDRLFGVLVSEDDFSATGALEYRPATVNGEEVNVTEIVEGLAEAQKMLSRAAAERDAKKAEKSTEQRS